MRHNLRVNQIPFLHGHRQPLQIIESVRRQPGADPYHGHVVLIGMGHREIEQGHPLRCAPDEGQHIHVALFQPAPDVGPFGDAEQHHAIHGLQRFAQQFNRETVPAPLCIRNAKWRIRDFARRSDGWQFRGGQPGGQEQQPDQEPGGPHRAKAIVETSDASCSNGKADCDIVSHQRSRLNSRRGLSTKSHEAISRARSIPKDPSSTFAASDAATLRRAIYWCPYTPSTNP